MNRIAVEEGAAVAASFLFIWIWRLKRWLVDESILEESINAGVRAQYRGSINAGVRDESGGRSNVTAAEAS